MSGKARPIDSGKWQVDLSGGGIRTALCSIGLLYWLDRREEWGEVRRIVSVSGGSLVSAVLADRQPTGSSTMVNEMVGLFDRLTRRRRVGAAGFVIGGTAAWLTVGAFGTSGFVDTWGPALGIFSIAWLVACRIVRVVLTPVAVMIGCLLMVWVDLSTAEEWIVLAVLLVVVPAIAFGWLMWMRSRRLDVPLVEPPAGQSMAEAVVRRIVIPILGIGGVVAAGVWIGQRGDAGRAFVDALRVMGWCVVVVAVLQSIVLPAVLRAHLSWVVGRPPLQAIAAAQDWNVTHLICTSDLREDTANYFILAPDGPRVLATEPRDAASSPRLADASAVALVTMVQASSAFIPVLQPVIPLTTRRYPGPTGKSMWAEPLRVQVFADGGIHGTLGNQFDLLDFDGSNRWAFVRGEVPDRRIVLDAARYRASSPAYWPLTMAPLFGLFVTPLRVMQMLLRGVVTAERAGADARGDEGAATVRAVVTGGPFVDPITTQFANGTLVPQDVVATRLRNFLDSLRREVDAAGSWWPSRRQGLMCAAAALAAAFVATNADNSDAAAMQQLRTWLSELEQELDLPGVLDLDTRLPTAYSAGQS